VRMRTSWSWAWVASAVAHGLFMLAPTPGASRHVRSPDAPLVIDLAKKPAPEPEPEPPSAPKPEPEPRSAAEPKAAPRPAEPSREPRAPAPPEASTPEAPAPEPPPDVDLDLKPKPGRFAARGASRGAPPPRAAPPAAGRVESSPIPEGLEPKGGGRFEYRDRGFTAEIARDGSVTFDGRNNVKYSGTGASFDVTEAVMAASGDDAFHTEKMRFLKRTAWFRSRLAARAREDDLAEARRRTLARVKAIWTNEAKDPADRREQLFAMWDECVESGDEAAVATARFVRRTVLGFIRRRLPEGHPDAFTEAELDRLNASRDSKTAFTPYDAP